MAITRAQQAKQMLQDGGRIGFRIGTGEGKNLDTVSIPASEVPSGLYDPKILLNTLLSSRSIDVIDTATTGNVICCDLLTMS